MARRLGSVEHVAGDVGRNTHDLHAVGIRGDRGVLADQCAADGGVAVLGSVGLGRLHDGGQSLVEGFAQSLGYACATTETVVELDLVDADLPSLQPPQGYSVSTYINGIPAHLRTQVGALKGMVDAQAPHGDLHWQPTPVTAVEYGNEIARWKKQGRTAVESLAVDRLGTVVAWTCLVAAADPVRPARVEGTLVRAQHRGQRLGAVVKAACLLATRSRVGMMRVRTSSDDENVWMRAINHELGFVPVEFEAVLLRQRQGPTA